VSSEAQNFNLKESDLSFFFFFFFFFFFLFFFVFFFFFFFFFLFFVVLGFELRSSLSQLTHSASIIFVLDIFLDRVLQTLCPGLALNCNPPDHCLLSS
jgi:hypothetical protein